MAAQFLLPQSVSISCAALSSVPFDRPTELECESPPHPPLFAAGHFVTADFSVLVGDSGCAEDSQHRAFTRKFLKRRRSRQDNEDMKYPERYKSISVSVPLWALIDELSKMA